MNANQHPGLVIPKRKRRTKVEMDEERAIKKKEAEATEEAKRAKILAAAALETAIQVKDKQAAIGIADKKRAPTAVASQGNAKKTAKVRPDVVLPRLD
jgi:hypothetical protein